MMADWAAFKGYNNGKAVVLSAVDKANLLIFGVHYYPTEALAEAHPNSVASFPNPAAAAMIPLVNAAIDDYNNARDLSPTQAANPTNPLSSAQGAVNTAKNALGLGNAFSLNASPGFLVRLAEGILGIILLAIGIAKVTAKVAPATYIARKAGVSV